ncbi:nitroreductase family protein [Roseomonas elaeocarpi]|uniref:Putative NAD(P)H nitroreductase n=1 Tax=Roseomonas elaeocarpi TaxID=907779 RepID=A0ABV6JTA9_9PROT
MDAIDGQRDSIDPGAVLGALLERRSVPAPMLRAPAPEGEELERILATALSAPDHGALRPWRFVLIRGEARARWADTIEAAMRARDPEGPQPLIDKQRGRILKAPLVIALGAQVREGKIPELEQLLTVAAGTMNVLNALHAAGYGAIWVTGANAYDPSVAEALGLSAPDRLLGFLFVGTPDGSAMAPARRGAVAEHVREWQG